MFSAYHAVKAQIMQGLGADARIQITTDKYWILFAQSLAAEAVERALSRTLFDSDQFFIHLNT